MAMGSGSEQEETESTTEQISRAREAAIKTGAAVKHGLIATKAGAAAFYSTVTNPVFWVAIVLILVLLLTWSSTQVVGQNENANGCAGIGGDALLPGSGNPDAPVDSIANMNAIGSWLMSTSFEFMGGKAMSKNQAAAIIGNMWVESAGLNPGVTQNHIDDWASNETLLGWGNAGGKAAGLIQWDGSRRTALVQFADSKNKNWHDMGLQLEWLKSELNGWEGSNLLGAGWDDPTKSVEDLTRIWVEKFERAGVPAYEERNSFANKFLAEYSGGGAITTGGSCLMGGAFDASSVVALAIGISYPTTAESRVGPGDSWVKSAHLRLTKTLRLLLKL